MAERLSSKWGAHTLWSHRQLDNYSRAVLCEIPPLGNKWCMKWRRPSSAGSTDRTLPALICGFWWVLAVTPGHNFHSAMWSQTASHSPGHQNPHTHPLLLQISLLHSSLLVNFSHHRHFPTLVPQQPATMATVHYSIYRAQYITKSGDRSLEICEIAVTRAFKASDRKSCRCVGPWGHPNTIF